MRPALVRLSRPRSDSSNSAFLLTLFLTCLQHLIVSGFFHSITDTVLAQCFFIFVQARTRHAAPPVVRRYFPFFFELQSILVFLRRRRTDLAQQFAPRLVPIGIGELLRLAFVD